MNRIKKLLLNFLLHDVAPSSLKSNGRKYLSKIIESGNSVKNWSPYRNTGENYPSLKGKYHYRAKGMDQEKPIIFTSCTNNYIPKAKVLASSVKKFHPDWEFCLLLGEAPPEGFDLEKEPFDSLILFEDLDIPNYWAWLFRHRVVEICTAAKGHALHYFAVRENRSKVIYLDPDIMVCHSLQEISDSLDQYDILLTPHQLKPVSAENTQAVIDNEICSLKHGTYNLGFVAVSSRKQGKEFATWWRDRLHVHCYDDIPNGIFTDQRWCDLAPGFFSKLHILRNPGYNAASWNLTDRTISRDDSGTYWANDQPLRFYHFTGYDSGAGKLMTGIYGGHMPGVKCLWEEYDNQLKEMGHAELSKCKWTYSHFPDGLIIPDEMRYLLRESSHLTEKFPNPFAIDDSSHFRNWYIKTMGR